MKYTVNEDVILKQPHFTVPAEVLAVVKCRKCQEHIEVKLDRVSICPTCGTEYGIDVQFKVWTEHSYDPFNPGP